MRTNDQRESDNTMAVNVCRQFDQARKLFQQDQEARTEIVVAAIVMPLYAACLGALIESFQLTHQATILVIASNALIAFCCIVIFGSSKLQVKAKQLVEAAARLKGKVIDDGHSQ